MILKASNTIELKNILVGDVWVASGQSNMAYEVFKSKRLYSREIQNAKNPYIRHFLVPKEASFNEKKMDLKSGNWKSLNPNNIEKFSAVAHFFAEKIYDENQIPIGIINSSLGGSPAQAWMTE
ncbi:MAG: sialate O-acetylesterase, partial [Bacteroidota bacterium]|nr:sialate O-acetylesterase [Bacteroidota bacterium]